MLQPRSDTQHFPLQFVSQNLPYDPAQHNCSIKCNAIYHIRLEQETAEILSKRHAWLPRVNRRTNYIWCCRHCSVRFALAVISTWNAFPPERQMAPSLFIPILPESWSLSCWLFLKQIFPQHCFIFILHLLLSEIINLFVTGFIHTHYFYM